MNIIVERNWRQEVRQRIHGVGNVGEPINIIFPTEKELNKTIRRARGRKIIKNKRITHK